MYEENKMGRDRTVVSTEVERKWGKGDTQRQRTPQGKKRKHKEEMKMSVANKRAWISSQ